MMESGEVKQIVVIRGGRLGEVLELRYVVLQREAINALFHVLADCLVSYEDLLLTAISCQSLSIRFCMSERPRLYPGLLGMDFVGEVIWYGA